MKGYALLLSAVLALGIIVLFSPVTPVLSPNRAQSTSRLQERLQGAGWGKLTPATFVLVTVGLAILLGSASVAVTGIIGIGLAAASIGALLPRILMVQRLNARQRVLDSIWPEVIDRVVSALRSGSTLPQAFASLGTDGPHVLRSLVRAFEMEYRATGSFQKSLTTFRNSVAHPQGDRLCTLLEISHQGGGAHTVSVLQSLARLTRAELATRGEVIARQSWITNAARLGIAAPWAVLAVLGSRPEARAAFNSAPGLALISIGVIACLAAWVFMRKIAKLPSQPRWSM